MCDQNLLGILLLAAEIAVIAACAMLVQAIQAGKSIFTAFTSMGKSLVTSTFIGAAIASLAIAAAVMSPSCTSGACGSQGSALLTAINVTIGMLAGLLASVLVSALIPGAVNVAGPLALVTLLGAAGSFAYLGAMAMILVACFAAAASPWLGLAAGLAFITAVVAAVVAIYGIVVTITTAFAAASG